VRLGGLAYAADFRVRSGLHAFHGMLGPVDDGPRQWLVTFDSQLRAWRRLLGATDARELDALLRGAHAALAALPGIRSLRWYPPRDWNEAPDERWSPEPGA
jgi:hypothetical protein